MTAEKLPRFVPSPMVDHRWEVTILRDRYDADEGKFTDIVTAIGPIGARKAAEDKHRPSWPDCVAVWVEEVKLDPDFHDECGYRWADHRPVTGILPSRPLPFGCPTELDTRAAWGDR